MTFDDFLARLRERNYGDFIMERPDVPVICLALAKGFMMIPSETQIVALSLYLGQVWAASQGDVIRSEDGFAFMLDFEKRVALFEVTARAAFVEAMRDLPTLMQKLNIQAKGTH